MAKSTKSAPVLTGLTADQLNDLVESKKVAKATVIAFLTEKQAKTGLRYPARQLLASLTGATPVAKPPEPVKPPAPAKPTANVGDLAEIIGKAVALAVAGALVPFAARLDRIEVALAAAKPAKAAEPVKVKPAKAAEPVKPAKAAEPVKVKPAKAAEPVKPAKAAEPVKVKPAKATEPVKVKPAKAAEPETMSEAEAREVFEGLKIGQLRDIADFDTAGMSKSAIIDEMVTQSIAEGVVIAAEPVAKAGKPNLKVVAREVAVVF